MLPIPARNVNEKLVMCPRNSPTQGRREKTLFAVGVVAAQSLLPPTRGRWGGRHASPAIVRWGSLRAAARPSFRRNSGRGALRTLAVFACAALAHAERVQRRVPTVLKPDAAKRAIDSANAAAAPAKLRGCVSGPPLPLGEGWGEGGVRAADARGASPVNPPSAFAPP